jgi:histidinol-phosphatase
VETVDAPHAADLEVAHRLATLASRVALPFFHGKNRSWQKADGTDVGDADMAVDAALIKALSQLRPEDAILSEESPARGGQSGRTWILDPVDGTYAFIAREPGWGTNVALEVDGEIVLGVVTRPVLQQRLWAMRGFGAFASSDLDGALGPATKLQVSGTFGVDAARVSGWPDDEPDVVRLRSCGRWADADTSIVPQLLAGEIDAVLGGRAGPWDFAPAVVLVREAGGAFHDRYGGSSIYLGSALMTNGSIDTSLRAVLGWPENRGTSRQ